VIKGSMFRGVNYKCAMLYYNNSEWARAIKEFEQIVNATDPHIYEMLAKCYLKAGDFTKYEENQNLAIQSYEAVGEAEKADRLRQNKKA